MGKIADGMPPGAWEVAGGYIHGTRHFCDAECKDGYHLTKPYKPVLVPELPVVESKNTAVDIVSPEDIETTNWN